MIFGFIVAKYVNSNAIVLVENLSYLGNWYWTNQSTRFGKIAMEQMKKIFQKQKPY